MQRQWRADRPVPMVEPRPLIGAADRRMPPEIVHHPLEPHGGRTGGRQGRIAAILDLGRDQQRRGAVAQQGIDLARVRPQRQQRRRWLARDARPLVAGQRLARLHRGAHPAATARNHATTWAGIANASSTTSASCSQIGVAASRPAATPAGRRSSERPARQQCPGRERHQQPGRNGDGRLGEQIQRVKRQQRERQPGENVVAVRLQHRRPRQGEQCHVQPCDLLRADADGEYHHAELRHAGECHGASPIEAREQRDGARQQRGKTECDQQPRSDVQSHEQHQRHVRQQRDDDRAAGATPSADAFASQECSGTNPARAP